MKFKLWHSIIIGIISGIILVLTVPQITNNQKLTVANLANFIESNKIQSFNLAVSKAAPAVVNIYSRQFTNESYKLSTEGLGSGVIMSKNGYLLTNYHVIKNADQIIVALQDGQISTAQLIGKDKLTDLAVLKIDISNPPVIPQNQNYQAKIGDIALAIGNPYNLGQTTTLGIISATGRAGMSFGRQDLIQTDAAINAGNSGGALVNSQGDLVGINTASFQESTKLETYGISFAVPYKLAYKIMQKLIADGRVVRGYLGIEGGNINPQMAQLLNTKTVQGIIVNNVHTNSPAAKAGIIAQDVLIKINDEPIDDARIAMDKITDIRPGTKISLSLIRAGSELSLPVVIEELPNN